MARDIMKGDMPALILAVLAEEPSHGYAIARNIERQSQDSFQMNEGTLYPALRILEQDGLIKGDWELQPSGPARKVYSITERGRGELTRRRTEWEAYAQTMQIILGGKGHAQPA
jgi:PadR family transcriptional regulator PadR